MGSDFAHCGGSQLPFPFPFPPSPQHNFNPPIPLPHSQIPNPQAPLCRPASASYHRTTSISGMILTTQEFCEDDESQSGRQTDPDITILVEEGILLDSIISYQAGGKQGGPEMVCLEQSRRESHTDVFINLLVYYRPVRTLHIRHPHLITPSQLTSSTTSSNITPPHPNPPYYISSPTIPPPRSLAKPLPS